MASTATPAKGSLINPKGWREASAGVMAASEAYRAAAASSGLLTASQLRARPQVERNTELLQKQKLALNDIVTWNGKVRTSMREVYRDQLRLQRMTVTSRGLDKFGREISDITVPTNVPRELDTINNKLKYARTLTQSAAQQMINWGKNTQWAGRQLTVGFTYPMALFGAATAKMAYDVDKQLTRISKVYDTTLGSEALMVEKAAEAQKLRSDSYALATQMARQYGAAATDVLNIEAELAATGLNGPRLLSATAETTRIATLGELDFQQAVDMTVALQTAFKDTIRTSDDLTNAFNMMNAVENATSLSIQDIAEATPRAASALAALGADVGQMTIMLTAMRSAGIDAAEGANALKSISARIINPEILKSANQFFTGFVDLEKLSKNTGGNLYEFVEQLARLTKGMDPYQRMQGFSRLFGAWQSNRGAAIVKGMADAMWGLNDASNQTARAIKTVNMSATETAAIAEQEVARKMNSISGKFQAAWESLKITAAKMGEAFLPIATAGLNFLDKVANGLMKFFKAMPDWAKTSIGLVAALAAIAGPLVMTLGLMGNLFGWALKIVGIGPKFIILNRAQAAAEIQAKNTSNAYLTEAESVQILTAELNALAAAQGYSTAVSGMASAGVGGSTLGMMTRSQKDVKLPPGYTSHESATGKVYYKDPAGKVVSGDSIEAVRQWKTEQKAIEKSTAVAVKNVEKAGVASAENAATSGKTKTNWEGTKVASGLFGAALLTTIIPGTEKWSGMIMTATTAIMGLSMAKDLYGGAKAARAARDAEKLTVASNAGLVGATAMAGRWSKIGNFIKTAGMRLLKFGKLWGPIGVTLAVGYEIWKKSQESSKNQQAMNDSADDWAKALGGVAEKYKTIGTLTAEVNSNQITAEQVAEKFSSDESMKGLIDRFKQIREDSGSGGLPGDDSEFAMAAMGEYIKMIDKTNLTARDAKIGLEAMFLAAKYSAEDAAEQAQKYFDLIGDKVSNKEYARLWKAQITELFSAGGDYDDRIDGMIKEFSDSMSKFGNSISRGNFIADFRDTFKMTFQDALTNALDEGTQAALAKAGIDTPEEIKSAIQNWEKVMRGEMNNADFDMMYGLDRNNGADGEAITQLETTMQKLYNNPDIIKTLDTEEEIVRAIADQADLKLDVYNLDSLINAMAKENYAITTAQAKEMYHQAVGLKARGGIFGPVSQLQAVTKEQRLAILNQIRVQMGLAKTVHLTDMFKENTRGTRMYEQQYGAEIDRVNQKLQARRSIMKEFMTGGWVQAAQGVWQSVTSAVASEAQSTLAAQQEAQTSALQASFDRESAALDARAAHWDKFYDDAIDKANDFYDKRIDGINKMIDREEKANQTRQRLFDAEVTRLQRLADMQNANIDFNMALDEGRLDEAAKMMNDAAAKSAANQMEDEQKRADYELEVRKASLEKQIELLEKQRDRRVEALEDARDAKQRAIEIARSRTEAENAIEQAALEERQAMQSKYYDQALAELNAYIPRSRKDLENHIKDLNDRYAKYGVHLEAQASDWATFISSEQNRQMAIAANNLKSDVNWAGAGFDAASGMMQGMAQSLGMSMGAFKKWLGVGGGGKRPKGGGNGGLTGHPGPGAGGQDQGGFAQSNHGGGLIGKGGSGRAGFSGGQKSMERTINARDDEYLVNHKAVGQYGTKFFDMLNGRKVGMQNGVLGGAGGYNSNNAGWGGFMGIQSVMAPFMAAAVSKMFSGKLTAKVAAQQAKDAAKNLVGGVFSAGKPGMYSDRYFGSEQLKNASIIASVGSNMGMSARDLMIGIMTAITESGLVNVKYGDRDSLGLFQQRPSMGWGTPAQVTNPKYASNKFFSVLRGVGGREGMMPWLAAQAVQRSAYSDGSNYRQYWDNAQAIFKRGLTKGGGGGGGLSGGGAMGPGGKHRPILGYGHGGLHDAYTGYPAYDFAAPVGTPVYAVSDGTITQSRAITEGGSPGNGTRAPNGKPYRSYGEVMYLKTNAGPSALYAHLSKRGFGAGAHVTGGTVIGRSGNTGNSTGPHLHFGATNGPAAWLRKGGELRWDNTQVIGHKGETMLTKPLTQDFKQGVKNFADGGNGGDNHHVTLDLRGAIIRDNVDIEQAMDYWWSKKNKKVGRKRKVD